MTPNTFTLDELVVILNTADRDSLDYRLALKCYIKQTNAVVFVPFEQGAE